jgi:acyl dehydratase
MKYFEDFEIGEKIITRARTITEADIVNFAGITGDWHPMHVDIEYAKNSSFQERIAHGMLVLSISTGLFSPEHIYNKWAFVALYGMDNVRFVLPTMIGDTIHVEMEVIDKKEKNEENGIVEFKYNIINQDSNVVVAARIKFLVRKK